LATSERNWSPEVLVGIGVFKGRDCGRGIEPQTPGVLFQSLGDLRGRGPVSNSPALDLENVARIRDGRGEAGIEGAQVCDELFARDREEEGVAPLYVTGEAKAGRPRTVSLGLMLKTVARFDLCVSCGKPVDRSSKNPKFWLACIANSRSMLPSA